MNSISPTIGFSEKISLPSSPPPLPGLQLNQGRLVREVKKPVGWLLEKIIGYLEVEKTLDLPPTVKLYGEEKGEGLGVKLLLKDEGGELSAGEMFGFCEKVRKYLDGVKEDKVLVPGCQRASLVGDLALLDLAKVKFFFLIMI